MNQGQSPSTLNKERQFAAAIEMDMQIVRKRCPRAIFRLVDLNAGSGWNEKFECAGTPLVAVELAEELLGDRWHAYMFEREPNAFAQLYARLGHHPRVTLFPEDNANILQRAQRFLTQWDVGCVIADPNGWMYRKPNGEGLPVVELMEFFKRYPKMDLLANLNGRVYKLMCGARDDADASFKTPPTYKHFYGLGENCAQFLKMFHKTDGLISSLDSNGHSHFVRLILRNIPTHDFQAWGLYLLNSPQAQATYAWLEERNGHAPRTNGRRPKRQMEIDWPYED